MSDEATETITFDLQWIHGKRKPGVDECDQGWLSVRLDPSIDRTNLLQMINKCFELEGESDGAFTYRLVRRDDDGVDRLVA